MPTFFDFYRESTGDARDDDVIALDFIREHPEAIDQIPELKAKAAELHHYAQEQFPVTAGAVAKNVVGSATRSFFGGLADIPEAIAVASAELNRKVGSLDIPGTGDPTDVKDRALYKLGEFIRSAGPALSPEPDPRLEESFWANKVPSYVGSAASFVATGAAGKLATAGVRAGGAGLGLWVAENAPIALAGAASQAVGAYHEALAKGADRDAASLAGLANLPIGATEVVPLGRMLRRLDGMTGGTFSKMLWTAGKETFEESAQEAVQAFASNYVAQKLYDKDRNLLQDLQENAAGGGVTGFLFSALTQAIGGALGGRHGRAQISSGDSTVPGGPGSGSTTPAPVIAGPIPQAAGPPNAPAGPAAPPAPVIAPEMAPLTGDLNDEDKLALATWAQQDVAGTLGVAGTAERDAILARNPQLASAYSIYREQAAQAETTGVVAPAPEAAPPAVAELPQPAPVEMPPAPAVEAPVPIPTPEPVINEGTRPVEAAVVSAPVPAGVPLEPQAQPVTGVTAPVAQSAGVAVTPVPPAPVAPVEPVAAAVEPFSMINDQDPGHVHLEGLRIDLMETAVMQAALHKLYPVDANGNRLRDAKGLTKAPAEKPGITHRITFFEDTTTGEVFGVGTLGNKDTHTKLNTAWVGKTPFFKWGMRLRTFVQGGTTGPGGHTKVPAGRFKALDTFKVKDPIDSTNPANVIRYANRVEYEKRWKQPAVTLVKGLEGYGGFTGAAQPTNDYSGAPSGVEAVDERTPADVLVAAEGFTLDEADAIYRVLHSVKREEAIMAISKATNKDALAAAKKMMVVIGPLVDHDPSLASARMLDWIYEAKAQGKGDKKRVLNALTVAVGTEGRGDPDGGGSKAAAQDAGELGSADAGQAASPSGGTGGAAGVAGADASAIGAGGQGTQGSNSGEADEVGRGPRMHSAPAGLPVAQVTEAYRATLFSAAQQGLDVTVIQKGVDMVAEAISGVYGQQAGRPMAIVAVNDMNNPSAESLYVLNAEVSHHVFAGLSPKEQARLQKAMRGVSDVFLGLAPGRVAELTGAYAGNGASTEKSSTQLTLDQSAAQQFVDFSRSIPDEEVFHKLDEKGKEDYGIETEPHITALFGLTEHDPIPVAKAVAGHGPIEVTLGKLSVFENPEYDVLKVGVSGDSLHALNSKLSKLPNEQSFADYQPHLTIAYLKKGEGAKYAGDTRFEGKTLTFDTVTFSPPKEVRARIGKPELSLSGTEHPTDLQEQSVVQEERLVDITARTLTEEGFNPAEARGIAQALWRAIKDLMLRAARVLHDAWMGATGQESGEAGARMAQSYFENRVKAWLAGDAVTLSFTDFMGGGSTRSLPMISRRGTWFTPAYGAGVAWRWNPDTFEFDVAEASADSVAAVRANMEMPTIRYHRPSRRNAQATVSPDLGPEIRIPDFAAMNEVQSVLDSQFAEFNAQGHNITSTGHPAMTMDQFVAYVLPSSMDAPAEVKAAMSAEMQQKIGATVPNPDVRLATLNEATKVETANKALVHLNKVKSSWERREIDASHALSNEPGSTQAKFDKQVLRTVNLANNYTNAEFLFAEVRENVMDGLRWLRAGLRDGFTEGRAAGRQIGVLEQMIRQIEGRLDGKIGTQYASVIDKLVARFSADAEHRTRFVVTMQKIAGLPVWLGDSDIATVREILRENTDPDLAILQQDTPESRALLAIAAGFAKSNSLAMHMLALRGEAKTDELLAERARLNGIIKEALLDNKEAFANARRDVKKLTRLAARGEAILTALEEAKKKQSILHDELMAARRFTEFYRTNAKLLDQQSANLEAIIGAARAQFEAYDGAEFRAPANATQAPKDWPTIIFSHTRDGNQQAAVEGAQRRLDDWLAAHPAGTPMHGGTDYNYAEATLNKLAENAIDGRANQHVRRVAQAVFGPMPAKLEQTGIPSLKNAARRLRDYLTNRDIYHRPSDAKAVTFSNAESRAMKAMGLRRGQLSEFRKRMDQAWFYFGQRKDLLYGAATDAAGRDLRIAATLDYLHLTGNPRRAMEAFMREWGDQSAHYTAVAGKMGNKVDDDALGMLRSARGAWGEVMRMMSGAVDVVFREMNGEGGAGGPWANDPFKGRNLAEEYEADPNDLRQSLAPLFSPPNVWRNFVAPIANRPGTAMFNGPEDSSGYAAPARVEDVKQAFAATQPGDIVGVAEALFDRMGPVAGADQASFVAQTVGVFAGVFREVKAQKAESSAGTRGNVENVTQLLMNARRGENWPPEFVTYRPFDLQHTRKLVNHLAFHAAFGRNMEGIEHEFQSGEDQLQTLHNRIAVLTEEALKDQPNATPTQLKAAVTTKAGNLGYKISELEQASKSLAMVKSERKNFRSFVNTQGGVAMEFRAWAELMSASVAAVVQGPATAMIDTISLFKPIQLLGVSGPGLAWTARNIGGYVQSRAGSLMELLGSTIRDEAGHLARAYELGVQDTAAQHTLKERLVSVTMNATVREGAPLSERLGYYFSVFGRGVRELISTGIPTARQDAIFPRIKPFGIFTSNTQHMLLGGTKGTWATFEDMTGRAVQWFGQPVNAAALADPGFRFTADHAGALGYSNRFAGLLQDKKAFETMLTLLNNYGLTLEGLAKDFLERQGTAGTQVPMLSDRAFARLLPVAPTEILQESNIGSRPSALLTNPLAHSAIPLVGWSIAQTGSVASSFHPRLGPGDWKDLGKGLYAFAAMMGVGLAYGLLRDLYDEELLGKKANRLTVGRDATGKALVDRMAQVGSLGIIGDAANSIVNGDSTAREFTIDSRVFAVSSLMNLRKAVSDWYHQGFTATYATVGRPVAQSFGLSGYLQYAQILNRITGATAEGHLPGFEQEARMTARINANNWLRVAGRGLNLEVRTGRGASDSVPNKATPYVREMGLAALGSDASEFADAYRNAVLAAREEKNPDPQDYVKRAFEAQHPLRAVFKTQLSEADVRRILAALPEDGRQDVMEAVRLWNRFGERISADPFWGKEARAAKAVSPLRSISDVLRSQARLPSVSGF